MGLYANGARGMCNLVQLPFQHTPLSHSGWNWEWRNVIDAWHVLNEGSKNLFFPAVPGKRIVTLEIANYAELFARSDAEEFAIIPMNFGLHGDLAEGIQILSVSDGHVCAAILPFRTWSKIEASSLFTFQNVWNRFKQRMNFNELLFWHRFRAFVGIQEVKWTLFGCLGCASWLQQFISPAIPRPLAFVEL